jgi:hypothetical protein
MDKSLNAPHKAWFCSRAESANLRMAAANTIMDFDFASSSLELWNSACIAAGQYFESNDELRSLNSAHVCVHPYQLGSYVNGTSGNFSGHSMTLFWTTFTTVTPYPPTIIPCRR